MLGTEDDLIKYLCVGAHKRGFDTIGFSFLPPVSPMVIRIQSLRDLLRTPQGSNMNNTVSYAVELQDNAKELPDDQRLTRPHRHLHGPHRTMSLTTIRQGPALIKREKYVQYLSFCIQVFIHHHMDRNRLIDICIRYYQ